MAQIERSPFSWESIGGYGVGVRVKGSLLPLDNPQRASVGFSQGERNFFNMSTELKIARVLLIVAGIGWVILVILQVFGGN